MTRSTDEILNDILRTLDEIRSVLILANKDSLKRGKEDLLRKGSIKEKIYSLCDGTRTASDIAKTMGKDNTYVGSYLSILRREGLVRSMERDGKLIHEQIF
jgi:DNA-binding transcriptional ArsR family regulator